MGRYREPAELSRRRSPRVLLSLGADDHLNASVHEARQLYPSAFLIVALNETYETGFDRFQRLMDHPWVDLAVFGSPDLDELMASWRVDNLLLRDPSGVICETNRRSSS